MKMLVAGLRAVLLSLSLPPSLLLLLLFVLLLLLLLLLLLFIIIVFVFNFIWGIYNYIPETNYVSRVYVILFYT